MQPVDGSFLYNTGKQMHPLAGLTDTSTLGDAFVPVLIAQYGLDTLLNRSVFRLRTSRQDGLSLLETLTRVRERIDKEDQKTELGWGDRNLITSQLNQFEAVFRAEMGIGALYILTQKKGLDTAAILTDGSTAFPDDLTLKVPTAIGDAQQAMKCIVYELPTAAGFHLHRANESVLRCYWDAVTMGAPRPTDRNMGTYLREMEKLKVGDKTILSSLRDLKDQHRNPLIHPEHSLESVDDAYALYCGIFNAMQGMLKAIPYPTPAPSVSNVEQ